MLLAPCLQVPASTHGGSGDDAHDARSSEEYAQESLTVNSLATAMRSASLDFSAFVPAAEPARAPPATFAALRAQLLQRHTAGQGPSIPSSGAVASQNSRTASQTPQTTVSQSSYSSGPLGGSAVAAGPVSGGVGVPPAAPSSHAASADATQGFVATSSGTQPLALHAVGGAQAYPQQQQQQHAAALFSQQGSLWAPGAHAQTLVHVQDFGAPPGQPAAPRPLAAGRVASRVQEDVMARACCNALLRTYARASRSSRALLVLSSMSECALTLCSTISEALTLPLCLTELWLTTVAPCGRERIL